MYNRTDIDNLAKETNYIRDNVEKIVRLSGISSKSEHRYYPFSKKELILNSKA